MALSNKLRGNASSFAYGTKIHKHIYTCYLCGSTFRGLGGQKHKYACRICGKKMNYHALKDVVSKQRNED